MSRAGYTDQMTAIAISPSIVSEDYDDFAGGYGTGGSSGVSQPANEIDRFTGSVLKHFFKAAYNLRRFDPVYSEILDVLEENSTPNWDGYQAQPLSIDLLSKAYKLSKLFSHLEKPPEVTPEPDGEIALEWFGCDGIVFSISIGQDDKIRYAGLFANDNRVYGVSDFDSPDKETLSNYIQKVISSSPDN